MEKTSLGALFPPTGPLVSRWHYAKANIRVKEKEREGEKERYQNYNLQTEGR